MISKLPSSKSELKILSRAKRSDKAKPTHMSPWNTDVRPSVPVLITKGIKIVINIKKEPMYIKFELE
jgi:hypothetical protein